MILLRSVDAETIVANTATFDISALADSITEGNEAYTISLRTGSILGAVVDTLDITVIDTSLNAPTYNLTGPATIDEDGLGQRLYYYHDFCSRCYNALLDYRWYYGGFYCNQRLFGNHF